MRWTAARPALATCMRVSTIRHTCGLAPLSSLVGDRGLGSGFGIGVGLAATLLQGRCHHFSRVSCCSATSIFGYVGVVQFKGTVCVHCTIPDFWLLGCPAVWLVSANHSSAGFDPLTNQRRSEHRAWLPGHGPVSAVRSSICVGLSRCAACCERQARMLSSRFFLRHRCWRSLIAEGECFGQSGRILKH
jgi:hypothetical protein